VRGVCVVCVCVYIAKNLRHGNGCFINGRGEVCVFVCVNHEFILYVWKCSSTALRTPVTVTTLE
jgi:hypothetical protein